MIFFESNLIAFFHSSEDIATIFFLFSSLSNPAQSFTSKKINCLCNNIGKSISKTFSKEAVVMLIY